MTVFAPSATRPAPDNVWYVDGTYAGSETGAEESPYNTITEALTAAAAGDLVIISEGTYTEDLTLVNGVSMKGRGRGLVTVEGTATATDVACSIEDVNFIDDGAGNAFYVTGTAVRSMNLDRCVFTSTATGDRAFECDNTAQILNIAACEFAATTGNANEVARVEQGTITIEGGSIIHADNTSESIVLEGDAATTCVLLEVAIQGQIGHEAAVANPDLMITDCQLTVGAVLPPAMARTNPRLRGAPLHRDPGRARRRQRRRCHQGRAGRLHRGSRLDRRHRPRRARRAALLDRHRHRPGRLHRRLVLGRQHRLHRRHRRPGDAHHRHRRRHHGHQRM